jgi:K+-sensing histidine kinase KdpD
VKRFLRLTESQPHWWFVSGFVASIGAVATVTAVVYLFRTSAPVLSLGVLYLFAVLPIAIWWGRAFAIAVALASMSRHLTEPARSPWTK